MTTASKEAKPGKPGGGHDANWPDWYADYVVREQHGEKLPD